MLEEKEPSTRDSFFSLNPSSFSLQPSSLSLHSSSSISIFDLDHTLLKVNSSFHFGIYLYRHGIFSFPAMLQHAASYALHKMGFISLEKIHRIIFTRLFLGLNWKVIDNLSEEFVNQYFSQMLYTPAIERLKMAKQKGHSVLILSSSPDFLVSRFAERLNVDYWKATEYLVENEKFASLGSLMLSQEKVNCVAEILAFYSIPKHCVTAYSDSFLDLPLLKMVGHPVAVNPDRKLHRLSKKWNWEIL